MSETRILLVLVDDDARESLQRALEAQGSTVRVVDARNCRGSTGAGADELAAQIRASLGEESQAEQSICIDGLLFDRNRREVIREGQPVRLTRIECRILEKLFRERGSVVSFGELARAAGCYPGAGIQMVRAHIHNLRTKLGPGGRLIQAQAGTGYRLCEPGEKFTEN